MVNINKYNPQNKSLLGSLNRFLRAEMGLETNKPETSRLDHLFRGY